MSSELRIAACQMTSTDDVEVNKKQVTHFLKHFETDKVDLISFPENSLFFRIRPVEAFKGFSPDDMFLSELSQWARTYHTHIHLGSVPLQGEAKLLNATVWIDDRGHISFPYTKIHLFDVDVVGEKPVRESDNFEAGHETSVVQIRDWKIGLSICYDLRFAELYLRYAKSFVDVILVPSAFLVTTGQAHWHTLLRARAIEAQAYVVAAAQGGVHTSKGGETRQTYGHSLIVGPWGEILSEVTSAETPFIIQTLSRDELSRVRKQIPMANHRKLS